MYSKSSLWRGVCVYFLRTGSGERYTCCILATVQSALLSDFPSSSVLESISSLMECGWPADRLEPRCPAPFQNPGPEVLNFGVHKSR